jgi:site-specific recombinase XerD
MSIKLRKKKLANGNYSLWLDVYHKGQRTSETLSLYLTKNKQQNKETLIEAEKILTKKQYELATSPHNIIPEFKKKINFLEYYIKECRSHKDNRWQSNLKYLKRFGNSTITVNQINEKWINDYKEFLLSHLHANSADQYLDTINLILKKASREKIISENPFQYINKIKKVEPQRIYLSFDEVQLLANTPCQNEEVKKMFLFSCFSGLRYCDVVNLKWGDINNDRIEYRQQKTSSPEYLPLTDNVKRIIGLTNENKILKMPNLNVFIVPTRTLTWLIINKWVKKAGINKKVSFHTARHTFATLALTSGGDLYTVSKLLGHKTIATTQIYAKIIDEKKKETIDKLPNIEIGF